jgi:hypothetical protein
LLTVVVVADKCAELGAGRSQECVAEIERRVAEAAGDFREGVGIAAVDAEGRKVLIVERAV